MFVTMSDAFVWLTTSDLAGEATTTQSFLSYAAVVTRSLTIVV